MSANVRLRSRKGSGFKTLRQKLEALQSARFLQNSNAFVLSNREEEEEEEFEVSAERIEAQ